MAAVDDQQAGTDRTDPAGCACGAGGCGSGSARVPALDARAIDPALRQAAILGVLIGLAPGAGAVVVTDTSPDLVLTLLEGQFAGQYDIEGARAGEQEWRTTFRRLP